MPLGFLAEYIGSLIGAKKHNTKEAETIFKTIRVRAIREYLSCKANALYPDIFEIELILKI